MIEYLKEQLANLTPKWRARGITCSFVDEEQLDVVGVSVDSPKGSADVNVWRSGALHVMVGGERTNFEVAEIQESSASQYDIDKALAFVELVLSDSRS